jgi:hypothetical protein
VLLLLLLLLTHNAAFYANVTGQMGNASSFEEDPRWETLSGKTMRRFAELYAVSPSHSEQQISLVQSLVCEFKAFQRTCDIPTNTEPSGRVVFARLNGSLVQGLAQRGSDVNLTLFFLAAGDIGTATKIAMSNLRAWVEQRVGMDVLDYADEPRLLIAFGEICLDCHLALDGHSGMSTGNSSLLKKAGLTQALSLEQACDHYSMFHQQIPFLLHEDRLLGIAAKSYSDCTTALLRSLQRNNEQRTKNKKQRTTNRHIPEKVRDSIRIIKMWNRLAIELRACRAARIKSVDAECVRRFRQFLKQNYLPSFALTVRLLAALFFLHFVGTHPPGHRHATAMFSRRYSWFAGGKETRTGA